MFQLKPSSAGLRQFATRRVQPGRGHAVRARALNVEQYRAAKKECEALIKKVNCAPIMVRLAWHDSGTYDAKTGRGGANGTIRYEVEMTAAPNKGLATAYKILSKVEKEHPEVSWADLAQMVSAAAIEVSGGPKIDMLYGRTDLDEDKCGNTAGLPAASPPFPEGPDTGPAGHLRAVFHRMGFTDQEIVALSGAHTLGRVFKNRSGETDRDSTKYTKDGPGTKGGVSWTPEWLSFDNTYFKEIKAQVDPELIALSTDDCLFKDPKFKEHAELYAEDNEAFFRDYAKAHKKLSELGVVWQPGTPVKIE